MSAESPQPRVLVVDDETKLANLLQRRLRREGLGVDIAGSGEDALTLRNTCAT